MDKGLGTRIREARKGLGISQTELGDMVKTSCQTIHKLESGHTSSPNAYLLGDIADVLGVNLRDLMHGPREQFELSQIDNRLEITLPFHIDLDKESLQQLARRVAFEIELLKNSKEHRRNQQTRKGDEQN